VRVILGPSFGHGLELACRSPQRRECRRTPEGSLPPGRVAADGQPCAEQSHPEGEWDHPTTRLELVQKAAVGLGSQPAVVTVDGNQDRQARYPEGAAADKPPIDEGYALYVLTGCHYARTKSSSSRLPSDDIVVRPGDQAEAEPEIETYLRTERDTVGQAEEVHSQKARPQA